MKFVSLITEAAYWTSAIQRIGRIGRSAKGYLYLLTNKDFGPYLNEIVTDGAIDRTEFEAVLRNRLNNPKDERISGEGFRGDSFPFLLFNTENNKLYTYNETIFSMFDFEPFQIDRKWQRKTVQEKEETLFDIGLRRDVIEEFLIRDKLYPYWGFLKGRLSMDYKPIDTVCYDKTNNKVTVDMKNGERFNFKGLQYE